MGEASAPHDDLREHEVEWGRGGVFRGKVVDKELEVVGGLRTRTTQTDVEAKELGGRDTHLLLGKGGK